MVDLIAIAQGASALKTAGDIAKTIVGLRDSAKLLEQAVELNQQILAAQQALADARTEQVSLVEQTRALEEEIARLKSWEAEKQRYELKRYEPGVFLYTLRESEARGEPIHHLCAKCYGEGKKSIVQRTMKPGRDAPHFCPQCRIEFQIYLQRGL